MNRDFKGVWVPKEVWLDKNLTWMEKLFLVEISSLDNEKGCFASNKYFSGFFSLSTHRCSQIINQLVEKAYINSQIIQNGEFISKRILRVVRRFDVYVMGGGQKCHEGYQENVTYNNTKNNNTLMTDEKRQEEEAKEARRKLKDLFFTRYAQKAKEIKGTDLNADGKVIRPEWGAKEAKLLKDDSDSHGFKTIEIYMELFFSDRVKEVKDFCRGTSKAGYSFSVFHGMIGKLSLANVPLQQKCDECGAVVGHEPDCPIIIKKKLKEKAEYDAIMAERGNVEVDLVGALKQKIKERK